MKAGIQEARTKLTRELAKHAPTRGMYVRAHGDHLIMGRTENIRGEDEQFDRVRLTRLSSRTFGLSVKRHTGRWERTPFSGPMPDMVEVICTSMQHLVAQY